MSSATSQVASLSGSADNLINHFAIGAFFFLKIYLSKMPSGCQWKALVASTEGKKGLGDISSPFFFLSKVKDNL